MNKFQWFTFASLRAYPNQQLRKLCCALNERSLPFNEPVVHTLVRQVLYHIGKLQESDQDIEPLWKTDLSKGDFLDVISEELRSLGSEIAAKPSEEKTMLLLIGIARYMAQWSKECISVLKCFLKVIESWIADCDAQIDRAETKQIVDVLPTLRAKKALFYNYAVLCCSFETDDLEVIQTRLKYLVLAQNEAKFKSETCYDDQLRSVIGTRHKIVTNQVLKYTTTVLQHLEMLTTAVRSVITQAPSFLPWTHVTYVNGDWSSCFEAWDDDGNLYSINIMNGTVLCNGVPPSELPATILNHPLYKRTFGDRNFETQLLGDCIQTTIPSNGYFYSFRLGGSNSLTIKETDIGGVELRLLDSFDLFQQGSWGFDLPVILKENYSHWYCESEHVILLRGVSYCEREVEFVIQFDSPHRRCYNVPAHNAKHFWKDYLRGEATYMPEFIELVKHESLALDVLSKFEKAEYILTYEFPSSEKKCFHFPRFNLWFDCLDDGSPGFECELSSREYSGYCLRSCQQFDDTLLGFQRYLILYHKEHGNEKVIVPHGKVAYVGEEGNVSVVTDEASNACLKVHTYDVHPRFRTLIATSIPARIHLADLYAACSTLLPEPRMKMCGSEVAMQLIRRSWTNQPLEQTDYQKLKQMCRHTNFTPGLDLLCYELASSSLQTSFLCDQKPQLDEDVVAFPEAASVEYMQEKHPRNVRTSLTPVEEFRVLGGRRSEKVTKSVVRDEITALRFSNLVIVKDDVEATEIKLKGLLTGQTKQRQAFPLKEPEVQNLSNLHGYMLQKLEESHEAYLKLEDQKFTYIGSTISKIGKVVKADRSTIEDRILQELSKLPDFCGYQGTSFRILRSVNIHPILGLEDLVKFAIDRKWIKHFNPFLSKEKCDSLHRCTIIWMKYCVLEDKMNRLECLVEKLSWDRSKAIELQIVQELSVYRSWSAENHPDWLAFEVINGIQIRPIQYTVAKSMIDGVEKNPKGPITQLNMGEGKTRVILPMLAMYWKNSDNLVRFNFLSALLQEAGEYLHSVLSATVLNIPVFYFPFNRDVKLTAESAEGLVWCLKRCSTTGAVILCSPEHRMSLKLKWYELKTNYKSSKPENSTESERTGVCNSLEVCKRLEELDSLKYLDVLDEVDEILRTKNKLIYAVGSQEQLPSRESRLNVLQGLLGVVASCEHIQQTLSRYSLIQGNVGHVNGSFQEFQFVANERHEVPVKRVIEAFATELLENPPYELRWLRNVNLALKNDIIYYATGPHVVHFDTGIIDTGRLDDILALRGFLAHGLFLHCLTKRNRVDYGVNRLGGKKKLMAVPFRACETPSLRAEFGHPDCALMYTCLSYYYDGLSFDQILQTFKTLQSLGNNAQKTIYMEWFALCKSLIPSDEYSSLDDACKLDLSNTVLVASLFKYFHKNMKTVNFWLNNCVFPVETMQFPFRLEATAWDLAHNSGNQVAGFSGTNDDQLIMPSLLKWVEQTDLSLRATDGKMLHLLGNSRFETLQITNENLKWKLVLDKVISRTKNDCTTCALIDAGALMAGASDNIQVATYLAQKLNKGVVYFDIARNGWWVRDSLGRAWPKHSSPIQEKDGFVYFDESRTRGADMKLRSDASAVLTLGPGMRKDKLMQAAGRMRMLEHGQMLYLLATEDVASKIRSVNGFLSFQSSQLKPIHVLKWTMANSVENIAKWLPEWANQGGHFSVKQEIPAMALIPETISLQDLYRHELQKKSAQDLWNDNKRLLAEKYWLQSGNFSLALAICHQWREIDSRMAEFGGEYKSKFGSEVEEECERELEAEIEVEEEIQIEIPPRDPASETLWDFRLLDLMNPQDLFRTILALSLGTFVAYRVSFQRICANIMWPSNIFGTRNFFETIQDDNFNRTANLNDYLRLVDSFVMFPSGEILLLSELEADKILELTWTSNCRNFVLMNLTYARKRKLVVRWSLYRPFTYEVNLQSPRSGQAFFAVPEMISDQALAALSLFQGLVMFPNEVQRNQVQQIVASSSFGKLAAPMFCEMRGLGFTYARSDLEGICT